MQQRAGREPGADTARAGNDAAPSRDPAIPRVTHLSRRLVRRWGLSAAELPAVEELVRAAARDVLAAEAGGVLELPRGLELAVELDAAARQSELPVGAAGPAPSRRERVEADRAVLSALRGSPPPAEPAAPPPTTAPGRLPRVVALHAARRQRRRAVRLAAVASVSAVLLNTAALTLASAGHLDLTPTTDAPQVTRGRVVTDDVADDGQPAGDTTPRPPQAPRTGRTGPGSGVDAPAVGTPTGPPAEDAAPHPATPDRDEEPTGPGGGETPRQQPAPAPGTDATPPHADDGAGRRPARTPDRDADHGRPAAPGDRGAQPVEDRAPAEPGRDRPPAPGRGPHGPPGRHPGDRAPGQSGPGPEHPERPPRAEVPPLDLPDLGRGPQDAEHPGDNGKRPPHAGPPPHAGRRPG